MVVVRYFWCHSGVDSICKGGSCNSCRSLYTKFSEGACGGGGDGCGCGVGGGGGFLVVVVVVVVVVGYW